MFTFETRCHYGLLRTNIIYNNKFLLGLCLTCNSCRDDKPCDGDDTVECKGNETFCISVGDSDIHAYFRGCDDEEDICEKMSNGEMLYSQCESCSEDKCNKMKLT